MILKYILFLVLVLFNILRYVVDNLLLLSTESFKGPLNYLVKIYRDYHKSGKDKCAAEVKGNYVKPMRDNEDCKNEENSH